MLKILMITILFIFSNNISFASEYVIFSICSDASIDYLDHVNNAQAFFGHHSWLAITNLNKETIKINSIALKSRETMTLGTWQGGIHNGIFYNVERFYYDKGEFSLNQSAYNMQLLNEFGLNYLNSIITNENNDVWSISNNCANFAERTWNSLSKQNSNHKVIINAGIIKTPIKLYESILQSGGKIGLIMPGVGSKIYYGAKKVVEFEL